MNQETKMLTPSLRVTRKVWHNVSYNKSRSRIEYAGYRDTITMDGGSLRTSRQSHQQAM